MKLEREFIIEPPSASTFLLPVSENGKDILNHLSEITASLQAITKSKSIYDLFQ